MPDTLLLDEPFVVQPVQAIDAPFMWIESIHINTPAPDREGDVSIAYYPMDANGVVYKTDPYGATLVRTISTNTLFADIQTVPELATAFAAILAAVKPLEAVKG